MASDSIMTAGRVPVRLLCGAAMSAALLASVPAFGQTAPTADPATAAEPESQAPAAPAEAEIIITGSRIARSGFNTPVPVTMVGAEDIARRGSANVAEVLNEIPSFRPQSSPTTSAIFISNLGASIADLRGLGGNRTLVLIDGRRVVASTVQGGSFTPANAVDLNLVPTSLLARAEVVTGGASAAYGSDAVAGVTNLIINRDLEGLRGTIQYGQTERSDGEEFFGSLAFGTRFSDGRGRFVIGGDFAVNQGLGDCYTRDWCAAGYNTVNNPFVAGSTTTRVLAGQPAIVILPNTITATASRGGLVVAGPLRGLEFGPNGTTLQHDYGTYGSGLFQSGGGPDKGNSFYQFFPLSTPLERVNLLSDLQFEASDALKLNVQASYGRVYGTLLGTQRRDVSPTGAYQIRNDNAFLPDSVRTRMASAGVTTLPFGRIWNDIGPGRGEVTRETYRIVAGLSWKIANDLSLDAYYQFGQTDYSQRGYNTTINSRMGFAVDSVRDPATNQIVCRATLPGPAFRAAAAGCVPINPFGNGSPSADAIGYVTGTVMQDTQIKQHVGALTLRGDVVDLWAGPLSFATGVEYRKDIVASQIDAISAANDFFSSPGSGIVGGRRSLDVKEGFVELALPLARNVPFAHSAELNGAVRYTDYSTSGTVTTWKIGAEWAPIPALRLRGTRSRDIRAPNLFELYATPLSSFQTVDDPANGGARGLIPTLLQGNAALRPEVANTWTVGGVVTGEFGGAGTLRLSVDYFDISLDGAISTLGAQIIVNRCAQGVTALCPLITRGSNNQLVQILNQNLNLNTLITRGFDIEADYRVTLGAAKLGVRALATIVNDLTTVDSSGLAIDRAGQNGAGVSQPSGLPRYTINAAATAEVGPVFGQLQLRYIPEGRYQVTSIGPDEPGYSPTLANSISNNRVPPVAYVNLNMTYRLFDRDGQRVEVFGVVNNLFDKDPPNMLPASGGSTNPVLYDVLGRSYKVGLRFQF